MKIQTIWQAINIKVKVLELLPGDTTLTYFGIDIKETSLSAIAEISCEPFVTATAYSIELQRC